MNVLYALASRASIATAVLMLAILFAPAPAAAQMRPTFTVVSGAMQTVRVGSATPRRLSLRLTDRQGRPMPGVRVEFLVNHCIPHSGPTPGGCPPEALYGRFVAVPPGTSDKSIVITDPDGVATAAPFIAGEITGGYAIYVYLPPQQVGSTAIPWTIAVPFSIVQTHAFPIPAMGTWALALLACVALMAGSRRLVVRR